MGLLWEHHGCPRIIRNRLELVQILLDIFLELVDIADDVEDDHKCGGEDDSGADECAGDGVVEYSTHLGRTMFVGGQTVIYSSRDNSVPVRSRGR